ncbi:DUF2206 domain-containing protein, partial [Candidatus Bathyarchaeota archaeon]|nr:DUF2206 domain-containing protein [Candidatus Bathyarchaeota archaeon]
MGVIGETEVFGAKWLSKYGNLDKYIYADITSVNVFICGDVQNARLLSFGSSLVDDWYAYLRQYNVYGGIVFSTYGSVGSYNVSQIVPSLNMTNMIYSSGSSEIYKTP